MELQGIRQAGAQIVETVKAICRMCHGGCGTIVTVKDGIVDKVVGDPDNPINDGLLCSKGGRPSIEQLYHPDRIDYPMIRAGEKGAMAWRRVSWDEALSYIAERMLAIRAQHGAEAVAFARGTSINNNHITCRLANVFGSPNVISVGYFCYGPRVAVCKVTAAGKHSGKLWDTVAISDFYSNPACIVEWGSQKRTSNDHGLIGHTPMTRALKRNPVSIIVDPRKPAAAGKGDIWLPLRPGTDAAMALAWMNVIIEEGLYDKEFVEKWCHGFEELKQRVKEYPVEKVAGITWCNADDIRAAARLYARTKPATIAWGNGTDQLGVNTFQATRALLILMGITGNLDVPGGNCFWPAPRLNYPELWDHLTPEQAAKRLGGDRFKALNLTPYAYAHPPSLFRTILTEKPYPVKALIVVGNNTATCYPGTSTVVAALRKLDLLVVQDIFMTPTAEYADVVLPAAGNMERDEPRLHMHIKGPGGMFMDTSSRKIAQVAERRSDWEFIIGLGQALGYQDYFPSIEEFANEALQPMGMDWNELKKHDYVVEPMRYRKYEQDGFGTPTGKFEIWSTMMEEWGYDPLPEHVEPNESPVNSPEVYKDFPLILNTGVKQPMYWHSMGRQVPSLRRLQPEPLLEIHPDTAARYGLVDKAYAWIETRRGKLRMRVNCSPRTNPAVASVPHGWWLPEWAGPDHGIFEVCSNVLTDDDPENCDVALGSSPLKGLLCKVYPAEPPDVPRDAGYRQARERTLITTDAEA